MLCESYLADPGPGDSYPLDKVIVGAAILGATLAAALLLRFDKRSLFLAVALIPVLFAGFAYVMERTTSTGGMDWTGLFRDMLLESWYTVLPMALAAVIVFVIRVAGERHSRKAGQTPASAAIGAPPAGQAPDQRHQSG